MTTDRTTDNRIKYSDLRHQEIVGGGLAKHGAVSAIARAALTTNGDVK